MLRIHSCYSIKYGILKPDEIITWLQEAAYPKIALTDINSTSAVLGFVREMNKIGKESCVGVDFRNGTEECYTVIAKNNQGFDFINRHLTNHLIQKQTFPKNAPNSADCHVIYPWGKEPEDLQANEWIGFKIKDLTKLQLHSSRKKLEKKGVIIQSMTFRNKKDFNAHRLLRAIDLNCLLSKLPPEAQADPADLFLSYAELKEKFSLFPDLMYNTEQLLSQCKIEFDFREEACPQNKKHFTESPEEDYQLLYKLCMDGIPYRYREINEVIQERIQRELEIIREKEYVSYFLITWDFIRYARSKNYFYVGRGSGANSIVAYLLQITNVDPLELDLYFERFINLYRKNPPDFDIDFSWKDRDDVIAYIFNKYPSAALLCTYNTFQFRAAVREMGKVFGLPKEDIDHLSSEKTNIDKLDSLALLVLKYSKYISGLPSHLSVHAGGIIISEKPVTHYSALFLPPKGLPTTQFSMLEAEDVGLYKFDVLSQRGLSKIKDCLDIVATNQPENEPHDIHDLPHFKQDESIKELLRQGKALGCFYVESPGMRMLLIKLQVDNYLGLVAASSIIRPGVSNSGMMREYILRHRNPERRQEAHPVLLATMPETYGVMVYQEDVIKVAHHFGGLNLAEADILRRGMSGKYRSRNEFEGVKKKFYDNCLAKKIDPEVIESVWKQIQSFAGYAFSKGHSASYAVESYQSLYLKAYYPLEYMVATINNFGGYYRTEIYMHEARMLGARIEAPLLNEISYETKICGKTIYLGFNLVSGLEEKIINALIRAYERDGKFRDFEDLLNRVFIPLSQCLLLIRIGACRDFKESKKELFWKAHLYHNHTKTKTIQSVLFEEKQREYNLPALEEEQFEQYFEQLELLGFPLCNPFKLVAEKFSDYLKASEIPANIGLVVKCYGYLIALKSVATTKGDIMYFATWLDSDGQQIDSVHFAETARKYPFSGRGIYEIKGVITEDFGHFTLEAGFMRKVAFREDYRYSEQTPETNSDITTSNFRIHSKPQERKIAN